MDAGSLLMIRIPAGLLLLAQAPGGNLYEPFSMIRIFVGLLFCAVGVVVGIFYILTLSRALEKCSPQSRTMQPGMTWLLLIPLVSVIWHFFVVLALSASLGNEFRARGIPAPPEPGKGLGLAMCICGACCVVPLVNLLAFLPLLILWIIYWIKIADFSRMLDQPPAYGWTPGSTPGY